MTLRSHAASVPQHLSLPYFFRHSSQSVLSRHSEQVSAVQPEGYSSRWPTPDAAIASWSAAAVLAPAAATADAVPMRLRTVHRFIFFCPE